ncbi:myosin-2 heavy chain-like isoform X2 [Pseudomyrmex gracilis]|uniref:myosin-2 heavy chain-like isoform X2 n=1 Tax=Pseudomyrmex gracilis TaxID=219809 RepID=UPI000995A0CC|nr:myosin-2 heavy chain-like isoform X2 [Pseudomyrmex gracilis]
MSFSKAKIQRFNELGSEAPPPGAYDPKFEFTKVKGTVIERCDRFVETKSTCSADGTSSLGTSGKSSAMTTSTAAFRMPSVSKRMITKPIVCSKQKNGHVSLQRSNSMKYESTHQLADLRVECLNKDKTIQEHEKHIEELKNNIEKLEAELAELQTKQDKVEARHKTDIERMAKVHEEILNSYKEKHKIDMEMLRTQLIEVSEKKDQKDEEISRQKIETELRENVVDELSKRISALAVMREKDHVTIKNLEMRNSEYENTLNEKERDYDNKLELLEKEKSQLNVRVMKLSEERNDLETKLEKRQCIIVELQARLCVLECELDELKAKCQELTDNSHTQTCKLTDKYEKEIEHLKSDFSKEKEELLMENKMYQIRELETKEKTNKMEETNSCLLKELKDIQRLYKDVSRRLQETQQELKLSNERHTAMAEKYKKDLSDIKSTHAEEKLKLEQVLENTKEKYVKELENITKVRDKEVEKLTASNKKLEEEIKRVTESAQKRIENAEAVTRETLAACRVESEERVKKVIIECDAKVNTMIKEAQSSVEEEMHIASKRYKACLARMELERASLDEKLAQRDTEIAKLSAMLEELKASAETQESFSQSLQVELDKAESELAEKKEELRILKDHIRTEAAEMVARRKRFDMIMADNQASIMALSNRLMQSNAEVERLQYELKRDDERIDEYQDLFNIMRKNSQEVHDQVQTIMEELDVYKELGNQLMTGNLPEMESLKSIFEKKIESLKQNAAKEIARLQNEIEQKCLQDEELKNQLNEMAKKLSEAQKLLLKSEEQIDSQAIEIGKMELESRKLLEQLQKHKELEEASRLLHNQAILHKTALDEANSRIDELSKTVERFEENLKHKQETISLLEEETMRWKTKEYEIAQLFAKEKSRREEAEEEVARVTELNNRLKKYEEIHEQNAAILGHQNNKQKNKHVTQLKEKNMSLEKDLHAKNKIIEQQQKTIEKLIIEGSRSHGKGKENIGMVHSTPLSSPHKTTPLRNRND